MSCPVIYLFKRCLQIEFKKKTLVLCGWWGSGDKYYSQIQKKGMQTQEKGDYHFLNAYHRAG